MRTDKDFERFGKEVWKKCKNYVRDNCFNIDLADIMDIAAKNNLCTRELHDIDSDCCYWWGGISEDL